MISVLCPPYKQGYYKRLPYLTVANCLGPCELENCVNRVDNRTEHKYFMSFHVLNTCNDATIGILQTVRRWETNCCDPWRTLFAGHSGELERGLLRFFPDVTGTSNLGISWLEGIGEVTKRFASEEGRTNSSEKIFEFYDRSDFVQC